MLKKKNNSNKIRTKELYSYKFNIDDKINEFLDENPNIKIIDVKYCATTSGTSICSTALLIYKLS